MFEAYFKALLARNRLITETMIHNQQIIAELFSRNLDFGADFLHHQMRVFAIVAQWRDPGPRAPADAGETPVETDVEAPAPQLKVVRTRR
jgi:hypothetical protein